MVIFNSYVKLPEGTGFTCSGSWLTMEAMETIEIDDLLYRKWCLVR